MNQPIEQVSAGHVVKALILNCLGFLTAPLYLFSQFFVGKATEHLIGEGVKPEHLNDSRIGRVLDQLYEQGLSRVFLEMALAAVKRFGVNTQRVHLDSSSFCVQGEYLNSGPEPDASCWLLICLRISSGPMIRCYKSTSISSPVNEIVASSKTPSFSPRGFLSSYLNEWLPWR